MQNQKVPATPFEYGDATTEQPTPAMLKEIQNILKKHNAQNRFGLMALSDLKLEPGMVMNETTDTVKREQFVQPTLTKDMLRYVKTGWKLDDSSMVQACVSTCVSKPTGHDVKHIPKDNDN